MPRRNPEGRQSDGDASGLPPRRALPSATISRAAPRSRFSDRLLALRDTVSGILRPLVRRPDIRNVAIIAHVDHGKTTLVDGLLRQSGAFRANQPVEGLIMDSNDLERERGITILAKNAAFAYEGVKVNVIDTPGHADFSGEVERVLKMADGALLLVDAVEGPMPQTRFVLRKALEYGLKPIVVVNKIDRPQARVKEVVDEVYGLFIDLGATEEQIEFPIVYACGMEGWATLDAAAPGKDLRPVFDAILAQIPGPEADPGGLLQMQVAALDYNDYLGQIAIGRIYSGKIRQGDLVGVAHGPGSAVRDAKVEKLFVFSGLSRQAATEAVAGDLVAVSGLSPIQIGDTVTSVEDPRPLPLIPIGEPTVSMEIRVNDSPLAGTEGKYVTSRHLRERLERELKSNVALRMAPTESMDRWRLSGRGFLHLGVVLETLRREGYECAVSRPAVIVKETPGGKQEPVETMVIEVPPAYQGSVMELVGPRQAEMTRMETKGAFLSMEFRIPSRGIIGLRSKLLTATRGEAVMVHTFLEYAAAGAPMPKRPTGVLVSMDSGKAVAYAISMIQERGRLYVAPGDPVYEGMVVGETGHETDIIVNPCRTKRLTNIRSNAEEAIQLEPPKRMGLEEALEFIEDDELVELTPKSIRIRKKILNDKQRRRADKD